MMQHAIKSVSIQRDNYNQLTITIDKTGDHNLSLYWCTEPNANSENMTFIQDQVKNKIVFPDPLKNSQRIYFILKSDLLAPYLFAEKTLKIDGMTNLRDYGGYLAANGRRVKWGVLFRSNHLNSLTPQAIDYMKKLHIQTIIDFRSRSEINNSPNKHIGERETFNLDASAHTAELAAQFSATPDDENQALIESVISNIAPEKINGAGLQVFEQYRNFVSHEKSQHAFRQMIKILLDKNNAPNIQHCRGGKDRTGYGVMLIMIMLGVSKQEIIADYMLTRSNRLKRNEYKMAQYRTITDDENILGYLLSLIDTREEFILASFETMEQLCGSAENYIKQVLGFNDSDFVTLQDNYLE